MDCKRAFSLASSYLLKMWETARAMMKVMKLVRVKNLMRVMKMSQFSQT